MLFGQVTSNTINPDWEDNTHWTPNNAPGLDTRHSAILAHNSTITGPLIINNGDTVTINEGVTLTTNETVTIKEGGVLIINGTLIGTDSGKEFKVEKGTLVVNAGGVLDWAGYWTSNDEPSTITINGSVTVDGNMSVKVNIEGNGSIDVNGTLNNDGGSIFGCTQSGDQCCPESDCVLPIVLISFEGNYNNNSVLLEWSTASELNNDFFTIERANTDLKWEILGIVDGEGTSNVIVNYKFKDNMPPRGMLYYRLKQTDFDGAFSYSSVISVNSLSGNLRYYPNPVKEKLTVELPNVDQFTFSFTNNIGERFDIPATMDGNKLEFHVTYLAAGLYFLYIDIRNDIMKIKVVVQK